MSTVETQIKFGFRFGQSGAHAARTMMLTELTELMESLPLDADFEQYRDSVEHGNVLHKPTRNARRLTWRHLVELYGMRTDLPLFRAFRRLWFCDATARPLLACQLALARDPLLRLSTETILSLPLGQVLSRQAMEEALNSPQPDRWSPAMLKSLAQNINGTWTQAGFLAGRRQKHRTEPVVRPANTAFALFFGYLQGATGLRLFTTAWTQLLECRQERLLELARQASHQGLLTFKHSSEVIEITFPGYLTKDEETWLHE